MESEILTCYISTVTLYWTLHSAQEV